MRAALAVLAAGALVLPAIAHGQEEAELPSFFEAEASAAGVSFVQFKQPNPLPVGPGAFFVAESPEATGGLTSSSALARAAVVYPGPLPTGAPSLLCLAGATPACSAPPFPTVAEAKSPGNEDATVATDPVRTGDEGAAPITFGAGQGEGHAKPGSSHSVARSGGWAVTPPTAAHEAIVAALTATLQAIPGAKVTPDPALVSVGGSKVEQKIRPVGKAVIESVATAVVSDVRLFAGAVTIGSVQVVSMSRTNGVDILAAESSTRYNDVQVAGFEATMGPDGVKVLGQGGSTANEALNGSAARVAEAVAAAGGKLRMEMRSGAASKSLKDGVASSAADGLTIAFRSEPLTDAAPPQPPGALCAPINEARDAVIGPDSRLKSLPPICVVPDLTGTVDSYSLLLGRVSTLVTAQAFDTGTGAVDESLGSLDDVPADLGGTDSGGSTISVGGGGSDFDTGFSDVAAPSSSASGSLSADTRTARRARPASVGELLFDEARWLGDADLQGLYLAVAALALALAVSSRTVVRKLSGASTGGVRPSAAVTEGEPSA